jgi:hypothetical protein
LIAVLAVASVLFGGARPPPADLIALFQNVVGLRVDSAHSYRPILRIGPVLRSAQLENAARSGIPIRVHVRLELWRDGFIDDLAASTGWSSVLLYEPISERYLVRPRGSGPALRFAAYDSARAAIEGESMIALAPVRPGEYYYTARVTIETLSLSDLEELERWLQGELGPAVSGDRSIPGAIVDGAKRLVVRVLRLPTRTLSARVSFTMPDKEKHREPQPEPARAARPVQRPERTTRNVHGGP